MTIFTYLPAPRRFCLHQHLLASRTVQKLLNVHKIQRKDFGDNLEHVTLGLGLVGTSHTQCPMLLPGSCLTVTVFAALWLHG